MHTRQFCPVNNLREREIRVGSKVEQGMNFSHLNTTHLLNTHTHKEFLTREKKNEKESKQAMRDFLILFHIQNNQPISWSRKKKTVTESSTHFMNQEHQNDDMSFLTKMFSSQSRLLTREDKPCLQGSCLLLSPLQLTHHLGLPSVRHSLEWVASEVPIYTRPGMHVLVKELISQTILDLEM